MKTDKKNTTEVERIAEASSSAWSRRNFLRTSTLVTAAATIFGPQILACSQPTANIEDIEKPDEKEERKKWIEANKEAHNNGLLMGKNNREENFSEIDSLFTNFKNAAPALEKRVDTLIDGYCTNVIEEIGARKHQLPALFNMIILNYAKEYLGKYQQMMKDDAKEFDFYWGKFFEDLKKNLKKIIKLMLVLSGGFADEKLFIEFEQRLLQKPQKIIENMFSAEMDNDKKLAFSVLLLSIRTDDYPKWFNQLYELIMFYLAGDLFPHLGSNLLSKGLQNYVASAALIEKAELNKPVGKDQNYFYNPLYFNVLIPGFITSSSLNIEEKNKIFLGEIEDKNLRAKINLIFNHLLERVIKIAHGLSEEEKFKSFVYNLFFDAPNTELGRMAARWRSNASGCINEIIKLPLSEFFSGETTITNDAKILLSVGFGILQEAFWPAKPIGLRNYCYTERIETDYNLKIPMPEKFGCTL